MCNVSCGVVPRKYRKRMLDNHGERSTHPCLYLYKLCFLFVAVYPLLLRSDAHKSTCCLPSFRINPEYFLAIFYVPNGNGGSTTVVYMFPIEHRSECTRSDCLPNQPHVYVSHSLGIDTSLVYGLHLTDFKF